MAAAEPPTGIRSRSKPDGTTDATCTSSLRPTYKFKQVSVLPAESRWICSTHTSYVNYRRDFLPSFSIASLRLSCHLLFTLGVELSTTSRFRIVRSLRNRMMNYVCGSSIGSVVVLLLLVSNTRQIVVSGKFSFRDSTA